MHGLPCVATHLRQQKHKFKKLVKFINLKLRRSA